MDAHWIALQSIPPSGLNTVVDDQAVWETLCKEFNIPCRIVEPLVARLFLLPQEEGLFVKGTLKGVITLPCVRCAEDSTCVINENFASLEPVPVPEHRFSGKGHEQAKKEDDDEADDVDEAVVRLSPLGGGVEINPVAYIWQEFVLALPVKPLCSTGCKGLCPQCGCNRNSEACTCAPDKGDPRLAPLRKLKIQE